MYPMRSMPLPNGSPALRPLPLPPVSAEATRALPAPTDEAWLSEEDYANWLLPPEPRVGLEKIVQRLSLTAGGVALVGGAALLWALV